MTEKFKSLDEVLRTPKPPFDFEGYWNFYNSLTPEQREMCYRAVAHAAGLDVRPLTGDDVVLFAMPPENRFVFIPIEEFQTMATKQDLQAAVEALKQRVSDEVGEVQSLVEQLNSKVESLKSDVVEGEVLVTQSELDALVADLNAISERVESISGPELQVAPPPVVSPEPGATVEGETQPAPTPAPEPTPGSESGLGKVEPAGAEPSDVFSSESPAVDPNKP